MHQGRPASRGRQWLLASACLVLGAASAYVLWLALTGGRVPLEEDIPPARYTLTISILLGAAVGSGIYYAARAALRRRGGWT